MTVETEKQDLYHCSRCEALGEVSYSSLISNHQNALVKICVKNLPKYISSAGIKNLFLTVGKPISISFNQKNNSAFVTFECMNEAELAVRDLHCKPPYDLKVTILTPRFRNPQEKQKSEKSDDWDFSEKVEPPKAKTNYEFGKTDEVVSQINSVILNLGYDPSIRMRQRKLDFKTPAECVSLGRGYTYMGDCDRFASGLQKYVSSSENSKIKNEMNFFCDECSALTTKFCEMCSIPYCSNVCLKTSALSHGEDCCEERKDRAKSYKKSPYSSYNYVGLDTVTVSSTVVLTYYFTMRTVFVRLSDEVSDEKFTRLCNDIAVEAAKSPVLEEIPKPGTVVIAKYYEDQCFYRGKVVDIINDEVVVFFMDFGNTQHTDIKNLRVIPDYLSSDVGLAVKVNLKDVPEGSSIDSVDYFNKLTAEKTLLVLDSKTDAEECVLVEKESKSVVNDIVTKYMLPSWKKDESVYSKLSEVFYLSSLKLQKLEIGKTCNLVVSHFDEKEFLESEVFWMTDPDTDDFFHTNSEMYLRIREYCEFLKDDCYLPRIHELCLAYENGEWHRCVNLKSSKVTCCLFFMDDGHSSLIDSKDIRKMVPDFVEAPAQAVCCTLPDHPKLKSNKEIQSKVMNYLKENIGSTIDSVSVQKLMGDAYCLSFPEINKILE